SKLENLGDKFTVADLVLPKGVRVRAVSDEVLALIEKPRTEEELKAEQASEATDITAVEKIEKEKKAEPADSPPEADSRAGKEKK
ncbi:MAG: hypothetical protein Q8R12_01365, partial [bacterium]|nr:hypothetical protein [bacterium]